MHNLVITPRSLFNDLDRLFDCCVSTDRYDSTGSVRVDVRETDANYELVAEVPGYTQDDIDIQVENGVLSIQAERTQESETENSPNYLLHERRATKLTRSFRLPKNVEQDGIRAEFKNGLLSLHIPKAEEAKPKKIAIN